MFTFNCMSFLTVETNLAHNGTLYSLEYVIILLAITHAYTHTHIIDVMRALDNDT